MEACLVMKNNLKRVFANKYTYLLMILIPLLLSLSGFAGSNIQVKTIRVGVLNPTKDMTEQLVGCNQVKYEIADEKAAKTDLIMGKYQYLLDGKRQSEAEDILAEIMGQQDVVLGLSATSRFIAMLLTAYFVIATVYASKYIQDKEQGMLLRTQAAGVKKGTYLFGYALSTEIIVVIQIAIAMVCFSFVSKEFHMEIGKMMVIVLIISILVTIYATLHVLFCKREMTANIMASSIAVVLSILGGTFVAVEQMPHILQILSVFSPIQWVLALL